jgi:hypothetical protein
MKITVKIYIHIVYDEIQSYLSSNNDFIGSSFKDFVSFDISLYNSVKQLT